MEVNETLFTECCGSIISNNVILTAAHCTIDVSIENIMVRVGSKHQFSGGDLFRVKKVINHPNYENVTHNYDFALVHLAHRIKLKPRVKEIIELPAQNEPVKVGKLALVTGWGKTLNPKETTDFLRGVMIPIIDQNKCKTSYKFLTDQMVCAGFPKNHKRTCSGKKTNFKKILLQFPFYFRRFWR